MGLPAMLSLVSAIALMSAAAAADSGSRYVGGGNSLSSSNSNAFSKSNRMTYGNTDELLGKSVLAQKLGAGTLGLVGNVAGAHQQYGSQGSPKVSTYATGNQYNAASQSTAPSGYNTGNNQQVHQGSESRNYPQGPYASANQNNPYTTSYDYQQPNPFQQQARQTNQYQPTNQNIPLITNSYIPPTTFQQNDFGKSKDSFFDVTNPLSDKRKAINTYQPQNNFVNPSHFFIPAEDKYEMVDTLFGRLESGRPGVKENYGNFPSQSRLSRSRGYNNIDEGLARLGENFYNQNEKPKSDFSLGFFDDDDKNNFQSNSRTTDLGKPPVISPLKTVSNSQYGQGNTLAIPPTKDLSKKPNVYDSPVGAQESYSKNSGRSQSTRAEVFPYKNGVSTSYSTNNDYQDKLSHADQGRQDFNNAYNTQSHAGDTNVKRTQGSDAQSSFFPQSASSNKKSSGSFVKIPGPDFLTSSQPLGPSTYSNSGVFNNQNNLTPLFPGFSDNKRLSLGDFRSKNLLKDDGFGKTAYDNNRPTSTSILGNDNYRRDNFGQSNRIGKGSLQDQFYNSGSNAGNFGQSYQLNSQPNQQLTYGAGNNGFKQILGNTQVVKNGFDNSQSKSEGYSKSFDDNKALSGGGSQQGGFNTVSGSVSQGGGKAFDEYNVGNGGNLFGKGQGKAGGHDSYSNSYQSSDSFKNEGGYNNGDTFSDQYGFSDSNSAGDQYSSSDANRQDFKDGFENEQHQNDQKSFSNTDGYNNAFKDGRKYDVSDGYTDKVNYNNKNSDSAQTQYTTNDGYKEGVANVGAALKGQQVDPYQGLRNPVQAGLSPDANYKPFNVNGPIFE